LHAFFQHFIDIGFATGYRVMRREALDGFGKTLPAFTYRGELVFPDLEREHAAYEYVKQHGEQVTSLHVAMNSMVNPGADFFLETRIAWSTNFCFWPTADIPWMPRHVRFRW
jgi:hypothetical protein